MNSINETVKSIRSLPETYHEFLNQIVWRQDTIVGNTRYAFTEAIRRGMPRTDAFFDVAEKIWRSYCHVNWGVLNWQWKEAVRNTKVPGGDNSARGLAIQSPAPTPLRPLSKGGRGNGKFHTGNCDRHPNHTSIRTDSRDGAAARNGHHHGNGYANSHNAGKHRQSGGASLISYYA